MAETFGRTGDGTFFNNMKNYLYGSIFISGSAGDLASITVYLKQSAAVIGAKVKCAIYDSDRNFLTNSGTEEKVMPEDQDGWVTFNFITSPTVLAATDYWLVVWCGDTLQHWLTNGETNQLNRYAWTYNSWPPDMSWNPQGDYVMSIYATYEEAPPPAKKTLVQAALISIPPLIVLPTLGQILKFAG